MKYFWTFIFLLASPAYFYGETLDKLSEQGALFFQAKETKKAIQAYEKAKGLAKPGIQKEILSYNLGSSYLEDGQFNLAAQEFEHLVEAKDHLPDYLYKRGCYNLLISYLKEGEGIVKKEEFLKEHLDRGGFLLKKATELFQQISLQGLEKEEINSLWLKLKEVSFQFQNRAEEFKQSKLNLEEGIQRLLTDLQDQVQHHEQLGQKKLGASMTQYFLNKRFILEKKQLPYWSVVEGLLKKEGQERLSDQDEDSAEAKALLNQFQEAQNEHLASLDCIKENLLWQGRLRAAKAEVGLKLIDLFIKKEDAIDFCLQKRVSVSQKQKSNINFTSFFASLNHELKMLHGLAFSLIEAQRKAIESTKEEKDASLTLALLDALKKKVKSATEIDYDPHLYRQLKKNPLEIVYPLYAKIENGFDSEEAPFIRNELRATVERFELKSKLDNSETNLPLDLISTAHDFFIKKENDLCLDNLESFLITLDAEKFIFNRIIDLKSQYEHFSSAPDQEGAAGSVFEKLAKLGSINKKIKAHLDDSKQDCLDGGLKRIGSAIKMSEPVSSTQNLFLDEGYQWIFRLGDTFANLEKDFMKLLQQAILEQRHALKFSQAYPALDDIDSEVDQAIYKIALESQAFPVEKAKECASALKKEKGIEKKLNSFSKGLKAAQRAEELLKQEAIAWDEVSNEQKKALKFWEEALANNSDSNAQKNSSEQNTSSQGSSSNQEQNTANLENQNVHSQNEVKKDLDKIMGVLEKLQEMQQDDKIVNKTNQNPKKGLRPW